MLRYKSYGEMTDIEIEIAAMYILTSSSSEAEARQRFRDELGCPNDVELQSTVPSDAIGREARELVRALGGPVMKNGALVNAVVQGHDGPIPI